MTHGITAKVIEDSISPHGKRITTLQLRYPRMILSELNTHRTFSRSSSSSRAIPVAKMIAQVRNDPAMPVHFGANQPGMQAKAELEGADRSKAIFLWCQAAERAAEIAEQMEKLGLHKQVANRILEPFQFMSTIVTATEWDNFFALRDHEDAQPEIRVLAQAMRACMEASHPTVRSFSHEYESGWHLPYITLEERQASFSVQRLCKISAARSARVSYLTHDGETPNAQKDLELYARLAGGVPLHASPLEHQATPYENPKAVGKNFVGWAQFRTQIEYEFSA